MRSHKRQRTTARNTLRAKRTEVPRNCGFAILTALCLGIVWGASLEAADNTGANNTAEKNPTSWRARNDRESKIQSVWEERHGASTSQRKRLHHSFKRSQQERVQQQVLRDPFGEESAVISGEIKQAPQTKPRHAWNSQAGRVDGKAFRLITEDDPQHVSETRSKPEPTAATPTGSNFNAISRLQEVPVEFVTLQYEPASAPRAERDLVEKPVEKLSSRNIENRGILVVGRRPEPAPAPQAERDLVEEPVEKLSSRNVENRSILVVGRQPQPTLAPTGAPTGTPTGPTEQSAPEPTPTDAEDPSLLGDHLLGDHLLGDHVLGDHLLGDHLLGDHLLGDHLLGDHLPAKKP